MRASVLFLVLLSVAIAAPASGQPIGGGAFGCNSSEVYILLADGTVWATSASTGPPYTWTVRGNVLAGPAAGEAPVAAVTINGECDRIYVVTSGGRLCGSLGTNLSGWSCRSETVFSVLGHAPVPVVAGGANGSNKIYLVAEDGRFYAVAVTNLFQTEYLGMLPGATPTGHPSWGGLKLIYR